MPNLVFVTLPSPEVLDKNQNVSFPILGFLVKSLINKYCHDSRTSNVIDMKLRPVTKEPRQNQKKIDDDVVTTKYDVINTFSDLWLI